MKALRVIGLVSMLGVLTATSQTAPQEPPSRSGSTQPVSPVAVASWVTAQGSDGKVLDLAVVWRGSPAWFFTGAGQRSGSSSGTPTTFTLIERFGKVQIEFTLKDSPRTITIGKRSTALRDNNVVLVDGVDSTRGARVIKLLKIDPKFLHPREIAAVLGKSPEVVSFLRCDLKLPDAAQQKTVNILCARLADGR